MLAVVLGVGIATQARHVEEMDDVACWEREWEEALRKPFS
jgi:hypothetical protein